MKADPFEVDGGQGIRLVPDPVGDTEPPQVVNQPGPTYGRIPGTGSPMLSRGPGCEVGDRTRVADGERRLEVDEVRDHAQRVLQLGLRELSIQWRLDCHRCLPAPSGLELFEERVGVFAEQVNKKCGSNCVPRRRRATSIDALTPPRAWKTSTTSARFTRRDEIVRPSPLTPAGAPFPSHRSKV